jgi:hypothetical protein
MGVLAMGFIIAKNPVNTVKEYEKILSGISKWFYIEVQQLVSGRQGLHSLILLLSHLFFKYIAVWSFKIK